MRIAESQHVELKESVADIDAITITAIAFANNGGGKIYIGMKDDGTIRGVDIGRNTIENLVAAITKNTESPILPRIYIEEFDKKQVIVIDVEESKAKPHFYRKIAYKRVGKTNIQMDVSEIKQLVLDQSGRSFDETLFDFDRSDVDGPLFRRFLDKCRESGRLNVKEGAGKEEYFEKLNALQAGKAKLGLLLMFSKNPARYLPHFGVKFAKITSESFSITSLERSIFHTEPVFGMIDEVVFEVVNALPKRVHLEGTKRIEEPIVPASAIREFVANALVHCDYRVASSISVLVTPTYLEISNPGKLIDLKIEDLYKKHRSMLRNPFLARMMFLSGDIEHWGSGIGNAIAAILNAGLGLPKFSMESGFFTVRVDFAGFTRSDSNHIVKLLKAEKLSSRQVAHKLGMADRTARAELKRLVELGIVIREKKGRKIYYHI